MILVRLKARTNLLTKGIAIQGLFTVKQLLY